MMYGFDGWGWMGLGMALFWIFIIAGVAWLVLTLSRWQQQQQPRGDDTGSNALRILEERLARGEIDTEEFKLRRTAILESKR